MYPASDITRYTPAPDIAPVAVANHTALGRTSTPPRIVEPAPPGVLDADYETRVITQQVSATTAPELVATFNRHERRHLKTTRETLQDRQYLVARGVQALRRARAANDDYLRRVERHLADEIRPRWLTKAVHVGAKFFLVLSEVVAGAAALYTAGDPLPFAVASFAGVGVATVAAGTHIGIQMRRREQGDGGSLVITAVLAVAIATAMLFTTRYFIVGAVSGAMAFVTTMVALGSAFLGYQWHDPIADQVQRAKDLYQDLDKEARADLNHKRVRQFEEAEAQLRLTIAARLQAACDNSRAPHSALSAITDTVTSKPQVSPPTRAAVEDVLAMLVGPEILELIPKAEPL